MLTVKHNDIEFRRFYKNLDEREGMGDLIATECKFARWIPKTKNNKDSHIICLVHHFTNGEAIKELKIVEDYHRPFWITKKIHQKYKDKKEFEKIDRLQIHTTTQSDLNKSVCKALEKQATDYNISTIKDSPYLYAYEVPSVSFIKHFYNIKSNNYISDYNVVNLDIEFDVTGEFNDISIMTLSMNGSRHTAALRRLYKDISTDDEEIKRLIREKSETDLPDSPVKRECKHYNITLYDNDMDMLIDVWSMLHKMKPDFVTIHNLAYDIERIMERCAYWNYDLKDLLSDPSIPKHLRKANYRPANSFKIKKGVMYNIPFEERWATIDVSASFMIMDTMTGFAAIRQAAGKLVGGYGLDNLLKSHKLDSKLDYEDERSRSMSRKERHAYMSTYKPIEYTIYAEQDTVGMTNLENKIKDFTTTIAIFAGITDFLRFNSSTHKAVCNAYVENRRKGMIVGTTPKTTVDRSYLGTDNWIKTLSSNHIQDIGLRITNIPSVSTTITNSGIDLDCVSSYPNGIQAGNVSASTVRAEILEVGNLDKDKFKDNNIDLISSSANSLAYGRNMLNLPKTSVIRTRAKELYSNRA